MSNNALKDKNYINLNCIDQDEGKKSQNQLAME